MQSLMFPVHVKNAETAAHKVGVQGNKLGWHSNARCVKALNEMLEGLPKDDPIREAVYRGYEAGYVSAGGVI